MRNSWATAYQVSSRMCAPTLPWQRNPTSVKLMLCCHVDLYSVLVFLSSLMTHVKPDTYLVLWSPRTDWQLTYDAHKGGSGN